MKRAATALIASAVLGLAARASAVITMPMVMVGNPGNAFDPTTGYGSVAYSYNIGQCDVTASQYTAFLNAVASTADPMGLYNSNMGLDTIHGCGISQTLVAGHFTYATTKNPSFPVNYVSWGDAARFCNWLSNNQPTGAEGSGTTETGSYTLNNATSDAALLLITRNAAADYVIPTENEWYKAAYFDPSLKGGAGGYWQYSTRSNTLPSNVLSSTGTNNANYFNGGYTDPTNYLTPVGYFANSPSAYGTFDQGGDVWQWNEATVSGVYRGLRGGSFNLGSTGSLVSSSRNFNVPSTEIGDYGFRVAQVPEPASLGILGFGIVGLLMRGKGVRKRFSAVERPKAARLEEYWE